MKHKKYWSAVLVTGICIIGITLWLAVGNHNPATLLDKESSTSPTQFIQYTLPDIKNSNSILGTPARQILPSSAFAAPTTTIAIPVKSTPYDSVQLWERRIIIQTHSHTGYDQGVLALISGINGVKSSRLEKLNITTLEIPPHWDINGVIDLLRNDPSVQRISKDVLMTNNRRVPNDPLFNEQWGLDQSPDSDIDADLPEAWMTTQGSRASTSVIVAIIDSGIDYTHPDLFANLWINEIEQNGKSGQDDDGNGYIDDIYGINTLGGIGDPWDTQGQSGGHGTYVASVIGAVGNNGQFISGVNWKTRLLAIKSTDFYDPGPAFSNTVRGIDYLLTMKERGHNIRVINASFGGVIEPEAVELVELWDSILSELNQQGILFIAAAGNDEMDTTGINDYPAGSPLENVIAVGSIDRNGQRHHNFSKTKVDLAAPGIDIQVLRTASDENDYMYNITNNNLFLNANILCDDLEPPPSTGNRDCDNPSADTSPRWTAQNGWESTTREAFSGQHSWGINTANIPDDANAILIHQPISLKGYMTPSVLVPTTAPIVFSFRYKSVNLNPLPGGPPILSGSPVRIRIEFLVNSQVRYRIELSFFPNIGWSPFVVRLPPYLYEYDNLQFQFVLEKTAETPQVYIDDIAITAIQIADSDRTVRSVDGTSFSAPHVSGAAALLWTAQPELHHLEIRDLLLDNVDERIGLENAYVTGGTLNVANAISAIDNFMLTLSTSSIVIPEAQSGEFTAVLNQAPANEITVTIEQGIDNQTNLATLTVDLPDIVNPPDMVNPPELTFTPENWDKRQTIRITSAEDNVFQNLRNRLTFTVPVAGGGTQQRYIDVLVTNTDAVEIIGLNSPLVLYEDTSTTIDLQLSTNSTENFLIRFVEQSTVNHLNIQLFNFHDNSFSTTITANNNNNLNDIETQFIMQVYLESLNNLLSEQIINVKIINTETLRILGLNDFTLDESSSAILSLSLSVQPTETYTIRISPSPTSPTELFDLNVSPTTLVFTEQNWSDTQAVQITALADGKLADSSAVLIFQAAPDHDPNNIQIEQMITVTVPNSESLEILSPNDFILLDENTATTLSISLSLQPDRAYTVTIVSTQINPADSQCQLLVSTSTLTFNAENWHIPQVVRITALADGTFNDQSICLLTLQAFPDNAPEMTQAEKEISVIIRNTETLLNNLPELITLDEGTSTILSVSLSIQPDTTYTVTIVSTQIEPLNDQFKLAVTPVSLIFDEQTWSSTRAVTITAPADGRFSNHSFRIMFQAYSNNEPDTIRAEQSITVFVPNTESLKILGPRDLTLDENTATTLAISLSLQLNRPYTVTIISTQNPQTARFDLKVTPTALIFDEQNWDKPQNIQITAPLDGRLPDTTARLTFRAYPNNDPANIQAEQTISIAVTNTETLRILGLRDFTLDESSSAILSLSLSVQPTETYTIMISSPPDLNVSPTTLVFTEQNWSSTQAVQITAPADGKLADSSSTLIFQASPDNDLNNIQTSRTVVININNTETLRILGLNRLNLDENTPTTLFISLSLQPDQDYTVMNIPTSSSNELFRSLNVTPTTLIFNQQNWNRPQEIQITVPPDNSFSNAFSELTFTAYPKNEPENIQARETIVVDITNTETLRILGLRDLTLDENTSTTLSISLSLPPDRAYTVTIISTQNPQTARFDLKVTPTNVIFDDQNWDSTQKVQITAPLDGRFSNTTARLTFRAYPENEPGNIQAEQTISIAVTNTETLRMLGLRNLSLDGNTTTTLSISLSLQPSAEYTVATTPNSSDLIISPMTLNFNEQNWDKPQDVQITAPAINGSKVITVTFLLYPKINILDIQDKKDVRVSINHMSRFRIKVFLEGAQ